MVWVVRCGRLCDAVLWISGSGPIGERAKRNGQACESKKIRGKNNIVKQRTRGVGGFSGIKGRQQTFEFEDDLDEK